jgi:hypothetical protein
MKNEKRCGVTLKGVKSPQSLNIRSFCKKFKEFVGCCGRIGACL